MPMYDYKCLDCGKESLVVLTLKEHERGEVTCPACGHDNREAARFCDACGRPLEARCPVCGQGLRPGARFCDGCGANISAPLSRAAESPRAPTSYTPHHLAERILTSRSALEGERKHITVLFADLKDSLELIADDDPEEARRVLDAVLERMMAAVHRAEGLVNEGRGDGIMALFGAPIPHEDHALRACQAALAMQEAVQEYAAERERAARWGRPGRESSAA